MAKVIQEIQPEKETHHSGCLSKLSPINKYAIIQQNITGNVNNAV